MNYDIIPSDATEVIEIEKNMKKEQLIEKLVAGGKMFPVMNPSEAREVVEFVLNNYKPEYEETYESDVETNDTFTYNRVECRLKDGSAFKEGDEVIVTIRKAK